MTRTRAVRSLVALLAAVGVVGAACQPGGEPRPASLREDEPPQGRLEGEIVFVRQVDENRSQLVKIDLAGGGEERLDAPAGLLNAPEWSPDGSRIAFSVTDPATGTSHIWVVGADGSGARRVTRGEVVDDYPTWSPDGSEIIFASLRDGPDWDLFRMNADGTAIEQLTDNPGQDTHPAWSPAGDAVVFSRLDGDDYDLWVLDPQRGTERQATDEPGDELHPVVSPDGNRVAFESTRDEGPAQIWLLDLATHEREQVQVSDSNDRWPAFSPDGEFVAVAAPHLAVYRTDGEDVERGTIRWRLTEEFVDAPSWRRAR